jgi:hypothetical protein
MCVCVRGGESEREGGREGGGGREGDVIADLFIPLN